MTGKQSENISFRSCTSYQNHFRKLKDNTMTTADIINNLIFALLQKQNCSQLALCFRKMMIKLHSCQNTSCPNLSQVLIIHKINYHRQADTWWLAVSMIFSNVAANCNWDMWDAGMSKGQPKVPTRSTPSLSDVAWWTHSFMAWLQRKITESHYFYGTVILIWTWNTQTQRHSTSSWRRAEQLACTDSSCQQAFYADDPDLL